MAVAAAITPAQAPIGAARWREVLAVPRPRTRPPPSPRQRPVPPLRALPDRQQGRPAEQQRGRQQRHPHPSRPGGGQAAQYGGLQTRLRSRRCPNQGDGDQGGGEENPPPIRAIRAGHGSSTGGGAGASARTTGMSAGCCWPSGISQVSAAARVDDAGADPGSRCPRGVMRRPDDAVEDLVGRQIRELRAHQRRPPLTQAAAKLVPLMATSGSFGGADR